MTTCVQGFEQVENKSLLQEHESRRPKADPGITQRRIVLADATWANSRSRSFLSSRRPLTTTADIFWVFSIDSSGFASSKTRSANLPFSTVPCESSFP